jgi:soluble lytic murein transglycosylase-like protein
MKYRLSAGIVAALVAVSIFSGTVEARARHHKHLATTHVNYNKHANYVTHAKHHRKHLASRRPGASDATRQRVISMIKSSAPRYGVPTWFALRIAKVESGYNPNTRGAAGEYGVFQLKCATAKGIGFRGNCSALLNPSTNVQYGLKHLSMAVRMSHGNLKLAASKHNGGLGRKRLVRGYVAMVF